MRTNILPTLLLISLLAVCTTASATLIFKGQIVTDSHHFVAMEVSVEGETIQVPLSKKHKFEIELEKNVSYKIIVKQPCMKDRILFIDTNMPESVRPEGVIEFDIQMENKEWNGEKEELGALFSWSEEYDQFVLTVATNINDEIALKE